MARDERDTAARREAAARYLRAVRDARRQAEALAAEADEVRRVAAGLTGIDYSRDAVDAAPTDSRVPDAVARLVELAVLSDAGSARYASLLAECGRCLDAMGGRGAAVLRMRWLAGLTLIEIGARPGWAYARKYLSDLHAAALDDFYDYLPDGWS